MRTVQFEGITVYEDGTLVGPNGRKIQECMNGRIYYTYQGKRLSRMRARVVYAAFKKPDLKSEGIVEFIDGDETNCALDNLRLVSYAMHRANQPLRTYRRFTKEEAERIRMEHFVTGISIRKLAEKYHCSLVTVNRITKGEYYAG